MPPLVAHRDDVPSPQVESSPTTYQQYKITFRRPDGTSGTLTVSPNHMMLITGRRPATRGRGAASAEQGKAQAVASNQ